MKYREAQWGLSGLGKANDVIISVDEATSGPDAWEICFEIGSMDLRFPIASPASLTELLNFAKSHYGATNIKYKSQGGPPYFSGVAAMELIVPGEYEVWITKDGELPDRFRFSVTRDDFRLGFDLHDPMVSDLIAALEDLEKDLSS